MLRNVIEATISYVKLNPCNPYYKPFVTLFMVIKIIIDGSLKLFKGEVTYPLHSSCFLGRKLQRDIQFYHFFQLLNSRTLIVGQKP